MSTFNLISVKYGANGVFDPWIENGQADAWLTNMAGSEQYFGWLSEYNTPTQSIQPGTYGGQVTISADVSQPETISGGDIVTILSTAIDQSQVPQPDDTTLYVLHLPQGLAVDYGPNMLSCTIATSPQLGFCGYHSHFSYNNMLVKYAVLPYSSDCQGCAQSFEWFGSTLSHEIAESITDPLGTSWFDVCEEEIGDICNDVFASATGTDGNEYPVQSLWSNSRGECYAGSSSDPNAAVPTGMPTAKPSAGVGTQTKRLRSKL